MKRVQNNFDLLRLLAAMQVVVSHGIEHLRIPVAPELNVFINMFPGVAIFFVISGFLISGSYLKATSLKSYLRNRILRIYPGLWVCFGATVILMLSFGELHVPLTKIAPWVLGQLTFFPHTPSFLKNFGTGSVNGSLWTIPVELQFYLLLPLILLFCRNSNARLITLFGAALGLGLIYLWMRRDLQGTLIERLSLHVVFSWLYLFLIGVFLQFNQGIITRFLAGKFLWWLFGYFVFTLILLRFGVAVDGNDATPLTTIPLALLAISFAFTATGISERILHGNDISYGLYIYHMLVINVFVQDGWNGTWLSLGVAIVISVLFAMLSWRVVEGPALRMKRETLRQVDATSSANVP